MTQDDEPRARLKGVFQPPSLAGWSETELRTYITELAGEMSRAEAAILARAGQRAAAEAFFRATPP